MRKEFAGIRVKFQRVEVGESELCGTEGLCIKSQEESRKFCHQMATISASHSLYSLVLPLSVSFLDPSAPKPLQQIH